jgi:hypothetical protein
MRARRVTTLLVAVVTVLHTLTAAAVIGAAPPPPGEFVISYWYGPPPKFTTIEHYRRIKQAGFNVVFPPGPPDTSITREQNLRILDFCRELGLRAVIYDPRVPKALNSPYDKGKINAIVADYSRHPALMAYFIVDEPSASAFAALGDVVASLKQRDPKHPGFINLFPIHADPASQLGTPSYDEYVAQYLKAVDPFVISYDHYSLFKTHDGPHFFTNLAVIRNAAVTSRRPSGTSSSSCGTTTTASSPSPSCASRQCRRSRSAGGGCSGTPTGTRASRIPPSGRR